MNDTPKEIRKKQMDIMLSRSKEERFLAGMEMIDFTRKLVEQSILDKNINISESDLKKKVFLRYYQDSFSKEEEQRIINFLH